MDCEPIRDALSTRLDGEALLIGPALVDEHLAACPQCRSYANSLEVLHRRIRLRAAEPVPDLSARIVARAHPPQPGPGDWVRWALMTVALTEIALALPALILGDDAGATTHTARHLGSLAAALAVGLAYAAWRPARAYGLLPVAAAVAACTVITGLIDVANGRVHALGESTHVLNVLGLLLLWRLAGSPRPDLARLRAAVRPIW